jgi:hypothetical protein
MMRIEDGGENGIRGGAMVEVEVAVPKLWKGEEEE